MTVPTTPGLRARARVLAAIAALVLTVFGVAAPAASAGESETITTKRGGVAFLHKGERLRALDTRKDGLSIRAYLRTRDGSTFRVTDWRTDGRFLIPAERSLDAVLIEENKLVSLWMCYVKFGVDVKCSKAKTAIT